ncbi:target of Sbf [Fusarium falciforme]|nr:target of Sbf [Fusarium falciforme]
MANLSVHVRGPFNLKEFAVYSLGSENKKRDNAPSPHAHARCHGHHHFHEQRKKKKKRADWVTATIDGKVVSWENSYCGGDDSGIFDNTWGNSLSYLNANGNGGSGSPKVLKDVYIPSNKEFAIFSADRCDESCGYSRVPEVAYKGFSGANKVFLFHFKMPLDGDRGFNGDMPALWALNARIPRTLQYGGCSCWTTSCGEVDIYEVLASGDTKCKSTFHLEKGAGSSDYFVRPVDKFIKVATVFDGRTSSVAIKELPDDFDLSSGLSDATVREWVESFVLAEKGSSLYQLPA